MATTVLSMSLLSVVVLRSLLEYSLPVFCPLLSCMCARTTEEPPSFASLVLEKEMLTLLIVPQLAQSTSTKKNGGGGGFSLSRRRSVLVFLRASVRRRRRLSFARRTVGVVQKRSRWNLIVSRVVEGIELLATVIGLQVLFHTPWFRLELTDRLIIPGKLITILTHNTKQRS